MKDKQFSPVEITQVLKRIHEASKLYALHYPLHPRADLSIQGWTDFQKNNPSVDASAINSVLETFRKNKINALRYLSRFLDLETPVQFTLQDKLLQILDQVTENNLFSVFNGHILSTESHIAGDLQEETQVKIYKPKMDTYFDREVQVLKSLGRLVALDSQELIIVYQKIQGDFLKDILYHERREYVLKRYEDHYTELVRDFYYSTGLFHGSLKAEDVVIEQETGRFHFINFENSYSPSFDHYNQDPSPLHELEVQKAKQEFHVAILENRAVFALNHHKSGEARLEIQKLIDYLRGIEDYVKANYWQKVYDQTH
jgi:serine/threonine protein kinase